MNDAKARMTEKPAKRSRGRAAEIGLTKTQIVAAAIGQIDEKGLNAFSLRELARGLNVSPAAIYWHVGGALEDLYGEIAGSITSSVLLGLDRNLPWPDRLRFVFRRYRESVTAHANVAPLLGAQLKSNGVANLDWVEVVLEALEEAGFRGTALRDAFNALIGGLAGFVTMEFAPAEPSNAESWEKRFAERAAEIDPARFPRTHAVLPEVINQIFVLRWQNGKHVSYQGGFELLLDLLIAGLVCHAPANLAAAAIPAASPAEPAPSFGLPSRKD